MSVRAVVAAVIAVMLAVLGHGAWHAPMTAAANFAVGLLTGGHVTGLQALTGAMGGFQGDPGRCWQFR